MSSVDLAWLRMERPTNPMMIVGVLTFADRLSYDALRQILSERFLRFERFRQRPVHDLTGAHWETDAGFDLEAHLHRLALPARAGHAQLEAAVSELASTPLDPRRPLWQFHLIERYRKGSALIARFHHCYADGVALLRVVMSLTDEVKRPPKHNGGTHKPNGASHAALNLPLIGSTLSLAQGALGGVAGVLSASLRALTHPQNAARTALQAAAASEELARIAVLSDEPQTPLRGALSSHKQVAWAAPLPLIEVKTVGKALGCTVTDVLLATLAGALGAYMRRANTTANDLQLRALVPVDLREGAEPALGNHFGLVFAQLPIGMRNPVERLLAVHDHMQTLKNSAQPVLALGLLTALGVLPAIVEDQALEVLTRKASLVVSSVPGPKTPLYLAGARIEQQLFWVPQAGSIGVGASLLSYNGAVQFGLTADRNLIADPAAITRSFVREFEKLLLAVVSDVPTFVRGEHSQAGDRRRATGDGQI